MGPSIDTRLIWKREAFDGLKGQRDWSIVMKAYLTAFNPQAQAFLRQAEDATLPTLNAVVFQDAARFSGQLYYILVMTCKGQALDKVVNAGQGEGLEGWRALVGHHEPGTTTRHA